jgi:hypothetical protein
VTTLHGDTGVVKWVSILPARKLHAMFYVRTHRRVQLLSKVHTHMSSLTWDPSSNTRHTLSPLPAHKHRNKSKTTQRTRHIPDVTRIRYHSILCKSQLLRVSRSTGDQVRAQTRGQPQLSSWDPPYFRVWTYTLPSNLSSESVHLSFISPLRRDSTSCLFFFTVIYRSLCFV